MICAAKISSINLNPIHTSLSFAIRLRDTDPVVARWLYGQLGSSYTNINSNLSQPKDWEMSEVEIETLITHT